MDSVAALERATSPSGAALLLQKVSKTDPVDPEWSKGARARASGYGRPRASEPFSVVMSGLASTLTSVLASVLERRAHTFAAAPSWQDWAAGLGRDPCRWPKGAAPSQCLGLGNGPSASYRKWKPMPSVALSCRLARHWSVREMKSGARSRPEVPRPPVGARLGHGACWDVLSGRCLELGAAASRQPCQARFQTSKNSPLGQGCKRPAWRL